MNGKKNPLIEMIGVSKFYGTLKANDRISLSLHPGRIKAVLGENGAGKSTLMSILAGKIHPDEGSIRVEGQKRRFRTPKEAIEAGIGMVYQHFTLVEAMTVVENVFLGQEGGFFLQPAKMAEHVSDLARKYRLHVHPQQKVADLSMGEKQRVEILKLLHRQSRVLIFDEPTTVLTPEETKELFSALRQMTAQGKSVVFISHKLSEVMEISDEIAILRKGRIVDQMQTSEVHSKAELARRMVGREVIFQIEAEKADIGEEVLILDGLGGDGFHDVDLTLRQGEVVAVVGVAGNGQKPLVETLCGLREPRRGRAEILGMSWKRFFAKPRWEKGLSYIPEDRVGRATCPNLDLTDNFLMTTRHGFSRGPWLQRKRAITVSRETIEQFNVQPFRVENLARRLSGGNLQKMVLGREFYRRPRLIIAEQPSQGLDISATEEVWKHLLAAREHAGILLITGDVNEALKLGDRIAVMYQGRFMDLFPADDQERVNQIGPLMAGLKT